MRRNLSIQKLTNLLTPFVLIGTVFSLAIYYIFHSPAPNKDFFQFYELAYSLRHGDLPQHFKVAPLYSVMLIPIAEAPVATEKAILISRLVSLLGYLVFGLILLILSNKICTKIVFPFILLYLINPHYLLFAGIQPLADSWMSAGVLVTFYGLLVSAPFAVAVGLLLSMNTRYDGVFTLFATLWHEQSRLRQWRFLIVLAIPCIILLIWFIAIKYVTGSFNPYAEATVQRGSSGWRYLAVIFYAWCSNFLPTQAILPETVMQPWNMFSVGMFFVGSLLLIGAAIPSLLKAERRRWVLSVLLFVMMHTLIHMWFTGSLPRYTLPVNWLLMLCLVLGLNRLVELNPPVLVKIGFSCLFLGLIISNIANWIIDLRIFAYVLLFFIIINQILFGFYKYVHFNKNIIISIFIILSGHNVLQSCEYWRKEYLGRNAELIEFARWYRQTGQQERVATMHNAYNFLTEAGLIPKDRLVDIPRQQQTNPEPWLKAQGIRLLLWNETELDFARTAALNREYIAVLQEVYGPAGIEGSYINRVHRGQVKGWRAIRRFEAYGQHAVLYEWVGK